MERIYRLLQIRFVRPLTPGENVIAVIAFLWLAFNMLLCCAVDSLTTLALCFVPLSFWGNYRLVKQLPDTEDPELNDNWEDEE